MVPLEVYSVYNPSSTTILCNKSNTLRNQGDKHPGPESDMYGSLFERSNKNSNSDTSSPSKYLHYQTSLQGVAETETFSGNKEGLVHNGGGNNMLTREETKGTLWSGFINLTNTIIGAGMLGLPGAFAGTGAAGGSLLILTGAFFSAQGLFLLSKAAQQTGLPSSFYSVARAAVPHQYTILIDLAVALKCFGVATGYLITIGDCMVDALDHILMNGDSKDDNRLWLQILLSRHFWVIGAVLAVSPFSFNRQLDDLKKTSALALVFVFFLAFGIIAYAHDIADACPRSIEDCRGEIVAFTDFSTTLSKLPIFIFAFTCHQNVFPIVNELQNSSQQRLNWIIVASIGFSLLIFYVVAMEGYHTFGSFVKSDILLNYPENRYVTALRISIAFMLTLHYPLQLDPSRRCISSLVAVLKGSVDASIENRFGRHEPDMKIDGATSESSAKPQHDTDKGQELLRQDGFFYTVTLAFLVLSSTIAMLVDDLGVVLATVGATGSTLVSYILPGLIYVKLPPSNGSSRIMAYIQLTLGCSIMPVALFFVFHARNKETNHA